MTRQISVQIVPVTTTIGGGELQGGGDNSNSATSLVGSGGLMAGLTIPVVGLLTGVLGVLA